MKSKAKPRPSVSLRLSIEAIETIDALAQAQGRKPRSIIREVIEAFAGCAATNKAA
ncbi:MAG TPA: hypothetical protein V6C65_16355 [Allocoleopsis sp.]